MKSRKVHADQVPETWTGKRTIEAEVETREVNADQDQVELDLGDLTLEDFDETDIGKSTDCR